MTGLWILFGFKFVSEIVIFFAAFKMSISMSEWCLSVTGPEMLWNIPKICTWYRWARSDQGHYDHELFLRITCICIDVTAKCSDNIGTGFYIVGLHWLRQNPLFAFQLNDFIEIWESSTENEICCWLSIFQLVLWSWSAEFVNSNSKSRLAGQKD